MTRLIFDHQHFSLRLLTDGQLCNLDNFIESIKTNNFEVELSNLPMNCCDDLVLFP